MEETLKELGFTNVSEGSITGYYKTYKGFRLFIASKPESENWLASIVVGRLEISIPLTVNKLWVYGFNKENSGV